MKITIEADDNMSEVPDFLTLHNEDSNNDNFIQIQFQKTNTYLDISVDDLYFAVKAFRDMREERLILDKLRDE